MKIAFISEKGGASKTTFARVVSEYFKSNIKFKVDNNIYSSAEKDVVKSLSFDYAKPIVYNVTNSEKSITRFSSFISIIEVECINLKSFFDDLDKAIKNKNLSLFDFGADIFKELMMYEESEAGQEFFSNIDIMFIPIKYDQESIQAAENILTRFQVYNNISFVFCLTEYLGDVEIDFNRFYENKVLMSMINTLTRQHRGRIITVPFSRLIRESDDKNSTFIEYIKTLKNEQTRIEYEAFVDDTFSKFDYIFLGLNRDPELATTIPHSKVENIDLEAILEAINSLTNRVNSSDNNSVCDEEFSANIIDEISKKIDSFKTELNGGNDIESIKKFVKSFEPIDVNTILDDVKNIYTQNTKRLFTLMLVGTVLVPAFVFGLVGYFYGAEKKKNEIVALTQAQVGYANNLAKDLVSKGAANLLVFGKMPNSDTVTIACNEENERCITRYDEITKKGLIELK